MKQYPDAYISYLVEFHITRDYFECHELLEEYWKDHPNDPRSANWVGLIQLAVGQYHLRRGNREGARKMFHQSLQRLHGSDMPQLGLGTELLQWLLQLREALERGEKTDYRPWILPITDDVLLSRCEEECQRRGLKWSNEIQSVPGESIIHRHKLRDRSSVIKERQRALEARLAQREQEH